MRFTSEGMEVHIDRGGALRSMRNCSTGEDYSVSSDRVGLEFEGFDIELPGDELKLVAEEAGGCRFAAESNGISISLAYAFPSGRAYLDRTITLTNTRPESVVLKRVTDCALEFERGFASTAFHDDGMDHMDDGCQVLYESDKPEYYHCSLNVFMRTQRGGLVAGLKYPYWAAKLTEESVAAEYETNYRIQPGETLELPAMFCGVYEKTGFTCRKELHWKPRIVATEQEEMDWGEVRAMQRIIRDFIPEQPCPRPGYYVWHNSWWANRDLHGRMGEAEAQAYCDLIDKVKRSKCLDMLAIASVWCGWANFIGPCEEIDEVGDDAEFPMNEYIMRVTSHAKEAGMGVFGFCEPSARARHYRKDRPDWKLQPTEDPASARIQNCQANPDYEDWFLRLTCSAIDRCSLDAWAWDHCWVRRPMICYGENHGHEPGNCEFQQYLNVTRLIAELRRRYPKLLIEVYWGLKEAGTWCHKGLSSLENLYENNSPAPPGMTAADDLRFQHWYNHNYRFLPTYMNLAQINFVKEANGKLYSILSSLSASTHASTADWTDFTTDAEADEIYGPLRYWKAWASEHLEYLRDRIDLFGQPCREGGIDGTAHIIGDRGFMFVFNPWPEEKWGSVRLDGMIGLTGGCRYAIDEISSGETRRVAVCETGSDFVFAIAPKSALLFELTPTDQAATRTAIPPGVQPQPAFT